MRKKFYVRMGVELQGGERRATTLELASLKEAQRVYCGLLFVLSGLDDSHTTFNRRTSKLGWENGDRTRWVSLERGL